MTDMSDVHNIEREYELNNKKLQNSEHVSEENKRVMAKFVDECHADEVGKAAIRKYVSNFHTMLKMAPEGFELLDAEKSDIKKLISEIKKSDYAPSTKKGFKVGLKKFYKLMEEGDDYPDKVQFFDTNIADKDKKRPDILSKKEIEKIIEACRNDRDRAMYKMLYESGFRASELMGLQIKDITFNEKGVKVKTDGKTGEREVLLVETERYLKSWLSKHPFSDIRSAPLWVKVDGRNIGENESLDDKKISTNYMRLNLKRKATRAGVRIKYTDKGTKTSEVYPHLFRHSRATHLATELTESTMKKFFGWTMSSDMPQTYIHLSGEDVENEILDMYGVENSENKNEKVECPRCTRTYKGDENFCPRCSAPLNQEKALEVQELREAGEETISEELKGMSKEELLDKIL